MNRAQLRWQYREDMKTLKSFKAGQVTFKQWLTLKDQAAEAEQ